MPWARLLAAYLLAVFGFWIIDRAGAKFAGLFHVLRMILLTVLLLWLLNVFDFRC